MNRIPYARQDINNDDIEAVLKILQSDWLTQGPTIEKFEQTVAEYCGAKYAVAVSSATAALHIACLAAGLKAGEVVWTSPNTFVASANCALYCGGTVDFVDIDARTYNLSVEALRNKLALAVKKKRLPKILIPVHFSGQSCEMAEIAELANKYEITIIEDASHAIGGEYRGKKVGSCAFSDMTVFSFHPVKIITTGEGGMITTNRKDLYEKLLLLRSHGITRNPELMIEGSHGPWYYQQIELGFNYRMTDIQAALGISQMGRIDDFVNRRNELASRYNEYLQELPLQLPTLHPDVYSSFHLYVIRLRLKQLNKSHLEIFEQLRTDGILVNLHYIPVHTQPFYQRLGFNWGDFPQAEKYYQEAISIPMYASMSEEKQDFIIKTLAKVIR